MGLFDYIRCKYPLPVEGANNIEFQTKDTPAQYMERYEIREDGSLWHETYDTEDRSDPNATGIHKLHGCMTRVNERWERTDLTDTIEFGGSGFEFKAQFVDGKLTLLRAA